MISASVFPLDWHWIVAGDKTRVWSSAAADYLASDDPRYLAWVAATVPARQPTRIDSEASLREALDRIGCGDRAPWSLDQWRARLKARVDDAAEAVRLRYVTPGAGQALTYQEKAAEAARILGDPNPLAQNYPVLSASVGIEAADLAGVAALVRARKAAWALIAHDIEKVRIGTKKAIDAAQTIAEAKAAAVVTWPG